MSQEETNTNEVHDEGVEECLDHDCEEQAEIGETHESVGHETEGDNPIAAVAGQFGLNGQIFAAQLINFLIVLIVLWKFVYKPIVRMLDERSEKIEKSMKQADDIEKRVTEIEKEKGEIIVNAQKQAQEIIEKAHDSGKARQDEIITAAKREVERVIAKGKDQLAEERTAMVKEVKKDIIDIAVKAATRIMQDQIDETKSKSIAEEVVRKLT